MDIDNIVSQLIEEISKEWRETGYFGDAESDPGMVYAVARRFGEDLEGKLARIEHLEEELAKYKNMRKEATPTLCTCSSWAFCGSIPSFAKLVLTGHHPGCEHYHEPTTSDFISLLSQLVTGIEEENVREVFAKTSQSSLSKAWFVAKYLPRDIDLNQVGQIPRSDCKVSYTISNKELLWTVVKNGSFQFPKGWSLFETDLTGAREVAVFRVEGPFTFEDAKSVENELKHHSII